MRCPCEYAIVSADLRDSPFAPASIGTCQAMTAIAATAGTPPVRRGEAVAVTYEPRPGLVGIAIVNWLLNIVTFTLYRFWAKTRVRRHIWSCIRINGEPLEYTGTGGELFLGALVVFGLLFLPVIALNGVVYLAFGPESPLVAGISGLSSLIALVLYGMAVYRARRYRLSRTLWRGIRGTMSGSPGRYTLRYFGALLLKVVTLGWATPAMNLRLENRIVNETVFGSEPFRFAGSSAPLYRRYAVCWFAMIVIVFAMLAAAMGGGFSGFFQSLGGPGPGPEVIIRIVVFGIVAALVLGLVYSIVWAAYTARQMNTFVGYTTFDAASFSLSASTLSLIGLYLGNIAIFILTLGIGQPFVAQRTIRYFIDRLQSEGTVDWTAIRQSSAAMDRRGEGLADAFDVDIF